MTNWTDNVIAGGLALALTAWAWTLLRLKYLQAREKQVSLPRSGQIVLRYAFWSHVFPVILFMLAALCFALVFSTQQLPLAKCLWFLAAGLALYLALVTLASRLQARLTVQLGNFLFYNDGTTHQLVYSCQVARYTCDGFNYHILLKEGRSVKIPATFEKSELVMRFLEVALAAEPAHPVMASPSPLSNAR